MERMLIDAPFGNGRPVAGATPILGPYSYNRNLRRPWGLPRYYPSLEAWRRPSWHDAARSIDTLCQDLSGDRAAVLGRIRGGLLGLTSHSFFAWHGLIGAAAGLAPGGVVLDMTSPPAGHLVRDVFRAARGAFADKMVLVRLPPAGYMPVVGKALDAGLDGFVCCGPLPVPGGELAGRPLQTFARRAVADVANFVHAHEFRLVVIAAAGGLLTYADVLAFLAEGATHAVAAGLCLRPFGRRRAADLAARMRLLCPSWGGIPEPAVALEPT